MSPLVKVCPSCDAVNPATASFCSECEWDLMNVAPTSRPEVAVAETTSAPLETAPSTTPVADDSATMRVADMNAVCTLELIEDPALQFQIRDGQTIGRSSRADVELIGVPGREYLSRIHARFFRRGKQWFAQYVATGNFIKVDGEMYEDDSEVALENGSMLTLSLTTFRVHVNP
ncbi:FHA domain-containing protein [bacterium]|nr:MAG: FHA domain-containing protein [bacterium]